MQRLNEIIARLELRAEQLALHLESLKDPRDDEFVRPHLDFLLLRLRRYKARRDAMQMTDGFGAT